MLAATIGHMADQMPDRGADQPDPARAVPPSRRRSARAERRDGDVLAGPADPTRPSNPWPRLLAFGLAVVAVVVLLGVCVASFASAPNREVRVRDTEFQPGLPKYLAIPSFGADAEGRTYGAFLVVMQEFGPAQAFFSRAPVTGCNLRWDAAGSFEGVRGIFVDPCSDARFTVQGRALHDGASADLHEFDARREANSYVVSFEELTLGACRGDVAAGCSAGGAPQRRDVPSGALPDDFGTR